MDVTVSTVLAAPRPLVVRIASDPALAPRWTGNIEATRWHGEPGLVEGARFDLVGRFLRREMVRTYRVVEVVPGERLVLRTERAPFPLETTMTWWDEELPDGRPGTGMSLRRAGRPHGMTTLGSGAATLGMKRAMRGDLERLRLVLREEMSLGDRLGEGS